MTGTASRPLKILIYGLNYAPELTGIGKYTAEMAEWLRAHGHEVRVIAAPPYYPDWRVGAGYRAWRYQAEVLAGIPVWRTPLWVPFQPGGLKRLAHLASFALFSLPTLGRHMFWRPDVIWMAAPSFFCAPFTWLAARCCGAKAWIHIQDYEIDAAFDLGLLKGRRLRSVVLGIERWILQRFDRVSTISHRMLDRARQKGIEANRLVLFRNWVDIAGIRPLTGPSSYRQELGIADSAVVALYSGNMGSKQGLEVLAETARLSVHRNELQFVFCGNGVGREELSRRCAGLANVRFLDLQPLERLGALLGLADVHLLPQRADAADLVMPSKLTGMLASGRPVVATARLGTELAEVVAACGIVVEPEQPAALAAALFELTEHAGRRRELGLRARAYAESTLDRDTVLARFQADMLQSLDA
ncbi:MAG: glycosyltransferase WbuB [Stagnimonas sp.]|nr:glycosyltransferase WbuB [Stagnimonas sp.]